MRMICLSRLFSHSVVVRENKICGFCNIWCQSDVVLTVCVCGCQIDLWTDALLPLDFPILSRSIDMCCAVLVIATLPKVDSRGEDLIVKGCDIRTGCIDVRRSINFVVWFQSRRKVLLSVKIGLAQPGRIAVEPNRC